ncbi:hypothetical protein E3T28_14685 [Cryobacterium sinapicolor]|uniref:Septum formation-related domain-containing protein n=1 Tax=Cryobacterium sinapicolor TaxID=1259236 RepID=A0ABY2ITV4_9MICO|nr:MULTISPECIES: hypothetical protein [Cryobacterium]TFC83528.1 hypothetical protein E3O67_14485 [Cryobacterium sp. TMT3-29-2]TFC94548.1 hypothetical protein E3T28_14685 [Cryobacterium sinapicolor]
MIPPRTHPGNLPLLIAAACVLTGSLTGCSVIGDMLPTPVRSVASVPASALGEVTEVTDLRVGDCLREVVEGLDVNASALPLVPCSERHEFEVYARFPVAGETFPGDNAVTAAAESGCGSRFAEFVLLEYRVSSLDFAYLTPTEQSWAGVDDLNDLDDRTAPGGREVSCLITDPAGALTGTLAGAAR